MRERGERIESGALALDGRLHLPDGDGPFAAVVVCHPHPQYGGDMQNNVVTAVCDALVQRGIAALRFNFRGVGASEGAFDGGNGEADDVRAALSHLAALGEVNAGRVGLAGYSFGAMTAEAAVGDQTAALALISPPLRAVQPARLEAYQGPLLLITGDDDWVTPEPQFQALTAGLDRPVESAIIAGADHSWLGYERDLADVVGPFFARALTAGGSK